MLFCSFFFFCIISIKTYFYKIILKSFSEYKPTKQQYLNDDMSTLMLTESWWCDQCLLVNNLLLGLIFFSNTLVLFCLHVSSMIGCLCGLSSSKWGFVCGLSSPQLNLQTSKTNTLETNESHRIEKEMQLKIEFMIELNQWYSFSFSGCMTGPTQSLFWWNLSRNVLW